MWPWTMVLGAMLGTIFANAAPEPHSIAMTHVTGTVGKDIPVVKHKKEAGNGYLKGSPLFKKQQKMAEPAPPEEPDRSKPSLMVIFGAILIGLLILGCAAFLNKQELVPSAKYEPKPLPTSQTRLQSQRLGSQRLGTNTPEYVEYVVPQQAPIEGYYSSTDPRLEQKPRVEYSMPVSSGVVYTSGSSLPPAQVQTTSPYASMPLPGESAYGMPMEGRVSIGARSSVSLRG